MDVRFEIKSNTFNVYQNGDAIPLQNNAKDCCNPRLNATLGVLFV